MLARETRPASPFPDHLSVTRRVLDLPQGKTRVTEALPEDIQGNPVVFFQGFAHDSTTHIRTMAEIASFGRPVLMIDPPRRPLRSQARESETDFRVNVAITVFDRLGISSPTTVAGHSWGGMVAAGFAEEMPEEYIEKVALFSTAGFMERDHVVRLWKDYVLSGVEQIRQRQTEPEVPKTGGKAVKEVVDLPIFIRKTRNMTDGSTIHDVCALLNRGTPVTMLHGSRDRVFPLEKVRRQAEVVGVSDFVVFDRAHNGILEAPQTLLPLAF